MGTKASKVVTNNHLPKKRNQKPKWFEGQITAEQFEARKDKNGNFYGHHKAWKSAIWIGPYGTEEELSKVIESYVSTTKKPFSKRKELKNVHSVIMSDKDW